MTERKSGFE